MVQQLKQQQWPSSCPLALEAAQGTCFSSPLPRPGEARLPWPVFALSSAPGWQHFYWCSKAKLFREKKKNKKNKAGADEAFGYCQVKVLEGRATWHACVMTSSAQPIAAGRGGLLIAAALLHLQGKEQ